MLFAGDTSVIVNNPSLINSERDINMVFRNTNEWFSGNFLSLNCGKIHHLQFLAKIGSLNEINIEYDNKLVWNNSNLEFIGIIVDSTLSWKIHKDTVPLKLIQASYIVRRTKPYFFRDVLKMIYYVFLLIYVVRSDFVGKFHTQWLHFQITKKKLYSNNGGQN